MNEYIDVRGAWPVYFNGFVAVELVGFNRNITVEEARYHLALDDIKPLEN